jgi:hypothetical protein
VVRVRPLRYDSRRFGDGATSGMYTDIDTFLAMLRVAHDPQRFSLRRALFADGLLSLLGLVGSIDRVAQGIDELRFPEYRQQPLGKPVYIVAAPRSGTTFLHRMMAHDPQFTTFKLYQTFFPSITAYRAADRLMRVNGQVGRALLSIKQRIDDSSFGGWAGLHDTGLNEEEEDEALWALALATPAIMLVLPFPERFEHLRFVDKLPDRKREKLIAYYRACVQRHLFYHQGKTLLAKNVLLPGRFDIVRAAVPEARFVHIVRHPYEALASMMSLFTIVWRWHSPELPLDGKEARGLAQLAIDYYRVLHQESLSYAREQPSKFLNIPYRHLLADPAARVREIYERFSLTLTPEHEAQLIRDSDQQRAFKSEHRYTLEQFGLTKEFVYDELRDVFGDYDFKR